MSSFQGVWSLTEHFQQINDDWQTYITPYVVFAGGFDGSDGVNVMEYITVTSTGNTQDFGDLAGNTRECAGCSSSTRGIVAGGQTTSNINVIQYITIATTGNTTDFGDLLAARHRAAGCSNATRGLFMVVDT